MQAAFYELEKLLGVFLIVRTIKDQFKLPNIPVGFEKFTIKFR